MSEPKCPVCQTSLSFGKLIEPGLPISECATCHGFWISAENYWKWIEMAPTSLAASDVAVSTPQPDSGPAKRCPECSHFLGHHKVGHGLTFYLDHCGHCGGFWFDAGEWEALRNRGLQTQVHKIFSPVWQANVAKEDRAAAHEKILKSKLGEADYAEAMRIKDWIAGHKHRAELYAIVLPERQ
jgi:Zn-finger nucleic acid-binding protein